MLDFLKIKYLSIYQLISSKSLLLIKDGEYVFDRDSFDALDKELFNVLNLKITDKPIIKKILEEIFDSNRKRFFRSVKVLKYFDIYFTYRVPELNSLEKIEKALAADIGEVIKVVHESEEQNILDDLRNFLDSQSEFDTKEYFQIFLQTLFYISKFDHNANYNSISQIQNILRDRNIFEKFYKKNKDEYSDFLLSIFKDKRFDLITRSEIAGEELYKIVNKSDDNETVFIIVNDKVSLQKILLDYLEEMVIMKRAFDNQLARLYLRNLQDILPNTRKIVITEGANTLMNKLILENPYQYLKEYFVRQHPEPSFDGSFYQLDPFLLDYFHNDWNEVMDLLMSPKVQISFEGNYHEKRFYEFLFEAVELAKEKSDFKFIIEDKEKIELIEKFIIIKPRGNTIRSEN